MSTQTISSLDGVAGRVIRPGDADYDKARTSFYGGVDRRPAAIVRVANANDVSRVIALVRRAYSDAVTFTPVIRLGELEIDILNHTVRAGTSQLHLTSLNASN